MVDDKGCDLEMRACIFVLSYNYVLDITNLGMGGIWDTLIGKIIALFINPSASCFFVL